MMQGPGWVDLGSTDSENNRAQLRNDKGSVKPQRDTKSIRVKQLLWFSY
jgi:hypothetical protein